QQAHRTAVPAAGLVSFGNGIPALAAAPVPGPKYQSLHNVQDQKGEQAYFNCPDYRIGTHEVSKVLKLFPTVIPEYLGIDIRVDYKESDKKNAGKAHLQFFTDGGTEVTFPGHKP